MASRSVVHVRSGPLVWQHAGSRGAEPMGWPDQASWSGSRLAGTRSVRKARCCQTKLVARRRRSPFERVTQTIATPRCPPKVASSSRASSVATERRAGRLRSRRTALPGLPDRAHAIASRSGRRRDWPLHTFRGRDHGPAGCSLLFLAVCGQHGAPLTRPDQYRPWPIVSHGRGVRPA
jgi:hypothetical protein